MILGIIALILIAAAVILFDPVRYRVEGSCGGSAESLKLNASFHWLFRLISGTFLYEDGNIRWMLSLFGKKAGNLVREEKSGTGDQPVRWKKKKKDKSGAARTTKPETKETVKEKPREEMPSSGAETISETVEKAPAVSREPEILKREEKAGSAEVSEEALEKRIVRFFRKLKYTFLGICDKIKSLLTKKEIVASFLRNEVHQNALRKLIRELGRLLHLLDPDELLVKAVYGFSDPAYTGYVLAGMGILYPVFGGRVEVVPDFENKVLEGEARAAGKIRASYFVSFGLAVILDKEIRATYRNIRKIKI